MLYVSESLPARYLLDDTQVIKEGVSYQVACMLASTDFHSAFAQALNLSEYTGKEQIGWVIRRKALIDYFIESVRQYGGGPMLTRLCAIEKLPKKDHAPTRLVYFVIRPVFKKKPPAQNLNKWGEYKKYIETVLHIVMWKG